MPRTARKRSEAGIYHVMLRGINRQQIFINDEDAGYFLALLKEYQSAGCFVLYAYCLMGNHVHILLKAENDPLSVIMKRIGVRYVMHFNAKYDRIGHLFQDRYKSEPVDSDSYFLTVLRYIHNNPVKAGLCEKPEDYPLSSARGYLLGDGIADASFAENITGKKELAAFLQQKNDDVCLDDSTARVSDNAASKYICKLCSVKQPADCLGLAQEQLALYIPAMKKAGLSMHQISRLTGVPFGIVRKY